MAVTAVLQVEESSVSEGMPAKFTIVLTNSSTAVDVVSAVAYPTSPNASCALQGINLPVDVEVPASGASTLSLYFQGVFFANPPLTGALTSETAVGVVTYTTLSDGTVALSNTVNMQITPTAEPTIEMPTYGQLRYDSNNASPFLLFPGLR